MVRSNQLLQMKRVARNQAGSGYLWIAQRYLRNAACQPVIVEQLARIMDCVKADFALQMTMEKGIAMVLQSARLVIKV